MIKKIKNLKSSLKSFQMPSLSLVTAAILGVAICSSQALATEYLHLDYRDMEPNQIVPLKRDLANAYPHLPIANMQIRSVSVQTKSYQGYGDVYLRVGNSSSERRRVWGNPNDWFNSSPRTFSNVSFFAPGWDSRGPWQLVFSGDRFKVRRVTVELDGGRYPQPPGRPVPPPPPGRPVPPPPHGRYVDVVCESFNYQSTFCPVGFGVRRVDLIQQYSEGRGACINARSYFVNGQGIQVTNGCRGLFRAYGD